MKDEPTNSNGKISMSMLLQILTFCISIVVTGIGGTLFITSRIDAVNRSVILLDRQMSETMTIHKMEDWTLGQQLLYHRMLANRNTNIIAPDIDAILQSITGP